MVQEGGLIMSKKYITNEINESINVKNDILKDNQLLELIDVVAEHITTAFKNKNKILIAGNGGSAADSQHLAAEFVSRFNFDRASLNAIALTTDTSIITSICYILKCSPTYRNITITS